MQFSIGSDQKGKLSFVLCAYPKYCNYGVCVFGVCLTVTRTDRVKVRFFNIW